MRIDRRYFLRTVAPLGGAVALGMGGCLTGRRMATGTRSAQLQAPVLNAHVHVRSSGLVRHIKAHTGRSIDAVDGAQVLASIRADGVAKAVVLSTAYLADADVAGFVTPLAASDRRRLVQSENDFAARQASLAPDALRCFMSINPKRDYAVAEVRRCVEAHRISGLKMHFWNSLVDRRDRKQHAQLQAAFSIAEQLNLPVLLHAFNGDVPGGYQPADIEWVVNALVRPFSRLRVCFAHLGGAGNFGDREQAIFKRLTELLPADSPEGDRTFADLSGVLINKSDGGYLKRTTAGACLVMGRLIQRWGIRRLLWGTDNLPGYLEQSRSLWPAGPSLWKQLAQNNGHRFLGG